jgi:hypothetical protein
MFQQESRLNLSHVSIDAYLAAVMKLESSDARNNAVVAISSGCPNLPIGICKWLAVFTMKRMDDESKEAICS